MADVVVERLVRRYGGVTAVDGISFTVREGEFLTLLGPSGCGKSTTLGALAGLEKPDEGLIRVGQDVFFDGAARRFVPTERRNIGLVFQSYALWPHMTVADNLAFPLRLRRVPRGQQKDLIHQALHLVEMDRFADRYPGQLSGGQQQRVALARTLVYQPKVLLLDEPLSNLDAKLRERARLWLRDLQGRLGITTIYVTHDQTEALALSDRIAVMRDGRIVQLDTPKVIYEKPADPFVADFIGSSNFLRGRAGAVSDGNVELQLPDGQSVTVATHGQFRPGAEVMLAIRPERLEVADGANVSNRLHVRLRNRSYLGARWLYALEVAGQEMRLETEHDLPDGELTITLPSAYCALFAAPETTTSLPIEGVPA
jgi:iron(III) transport system ATP-binding protein